jgi:isopentenyl-diphosphate delta-isomerase
MFHGGVYRVSENKSSKYRAGFMKEEIILVDEYDRQVGTAEKLAVHRSGDLHRAFSIFVFNEHDEMLLQKRARNKYHSGGLWTNTCCSHPRPGENLRQATSRRLREEMGFSCRLKKAFDFIYKAKLDNDLTEHELDHVFVGKYQGKISPDKNEVMDFRWYKLPDLKREISKSPHKFTIWFRIALEQLDYRNIV